ncbi:MAG: hypothetical protein NXI04_21330 [Planctomycetaceae bacterium]|nr:hypothetical protein [Planctomycetaceae bacterium]
MQTMSDGDVIAKKHHIYHVRTAKCWSNEKDQIDYFGIFKLVVRIADDGTKRLNWELFEEDVFQ